MSWYWALWEMLVNAAETAMCAYFLYTRLGCALGRKKLLIPLSIIYFVIVSVENFAGLPSRITLPVCFVYWLCFALFICDGSLAMRIFWGGTTSLVIVFVNFLLVQMAATLPNISVQETFTESSIRLVMTTLYLILEAVCYMLLLRTRAREIQLPRALSVFMIALMLMAVVAVALLTHLVVLLQGNRLEQIIAIVTAVSLFFLTLGTSITMNQAGEYLRQNLRMRTEIEVNRLEKGHAQRMIATMNTMREWRHDFNNHTITLMYLLDREQYKEMRAYMEQIIGPVGQLSDFISTGNPTVDAILSSKQLRACEHQIPIDAVCSVPAGGFPIDELELCVLIGNLVDNAIEANLHLPKERRGINLRMRKDGGIFHLYIQNPSTGRYSYDENQQLKSIKKESNHGIGLSHIRRTVEGANGFLRIEALESSFVVNVAIPIDEGGN